MWRVQGVLGRFLGRCHGSVPLRLSQGHHVEDEVRNTSTVLSSNLQASDSSSHQGENGGKKQKKKTSKFCYSGLPRYTALDAVGWGAAAVLFMQACRKIHLLFSSSNEPNPGAGTYRELRPLHKCGYRVLLEILSRQDVLPRGMSVGCLRGTLEDDGSSSSNSSNSQGARASQMPEGSTFSSAEGITQSDDSSRSGEASLSAETPLEDTAHAQGPQQHKQSPSLEEELAASTDNLRTVADSSIPVILNIIGIETARRGDSQTAFCCFLVAAQHGYSKAQFNVGVCYDKARGVRRDPEKAAEFYRQAAAGGHSQAQYRYAKHLLCIKPQSLEITRAAIRLLESAASSGVREAQVYLGVLFTQEPVQDWQRAVHYLQMAAKNGDTVSLLYLGHCFTWGLGVVPCLKTAAHMYQRAAEGGNLEAQHILSAYRAKVVTSIPENSVLRSTRSAPCFSSANQARNVIQMHDAHFSSPTQTLPHSWSMGSLRSWLLPHVPEPQEAERALLLPKTTPCGWTVGVG